MADETKPQAPSTPTMSHQLSSGGDVTRQQRELIRRRQEVQKELESLKVEVQQREEKGPREQLKAIYDQEIERQAKLKKDIDEARKAIRELRKEKAKFAERRNEITEDIRSSQLQRRELQLTISSPESTEAQKSAAKQQLQKVDEEIIVSRRDEAEQAAKVAHRTTEISKQIGEAEYAQGDLSRSRKATRAIRGEMQSRGEAEERLYKLSEKDKILGSDIEDYQKRQRERAISEADRFSPQMLLSQARRGQPVDVEYEASKAGSKVARAGGTLKEVEQAAKASTEFNQLFEEIKKTKKALAELTSGTEEHAREREKLTTLEESAAEAVSKLDKIERDVEKRKMFESGGGTSWTARATSFMSGAANFGREAFDRLGAGATERYVVEEQRKQAQLQLQNMALTDTRNRTRDATAFLATGGGSIFGAETPFNNRGQVSGRIKNLGGDYANAAFAMPQYSVGMKALGGAINLAGSAIGKSVESAAINPLTGWAAGAGTLASGGLNLAAQTAQDVAFTSELAGPFGGSKVTSGVRDMNNFVTGAINTGIKKAGSAVLEKGGGNVKQFEQGSDTVREGVAGLMNALPNVMQRAYEAATERNKLMDVEQQQAQVQRVRERLNMAFAPALQQYMDVQPTMRDTMRSRVLGKGEREDYERNLERFSQDRDLGERGFTTGDILGQTNVAARAFGRFGTGGINESVAKSSMIAESMGLGPAAQSTQAMSRMLQGGIKDPAAMFTKAVKEGLEKGLQDSRQFQGLLDAATSSADSAAGFEGTLNNLLKLTGSGRASDIQTAKAAYGGIQKDMSGFSGDWTDMVKFDITNRAAKNIIKGAGEKGINLDREDRTSLQNLANFSPDDLQNTELVKAALTPNALKAIEAQGGIQKYVQGLNTSMMAHGTTDRAINATQSKDLADVRNLLAKGEAGQADLKKMFAGPEGREKLDKILALNFSGMSSTGDMNRAIGATQGLANQIGEAIGIDPQTMRLYQEKYARKDVNKVRAESGAANTMGEQMARGEAGISQENMALVTAAGRDAQGKNLLAANMANTRQNYVEQQGNMVKNVQDTRTVKPELEVKRIDHAVDEMVKGFKQMTDAFKDFKAKDFLMNVGGNVVVEGAAAIKGVILDNALTQAATEAGKSIADTVRGAFGGGSPPPTTSRPPSSNKSPPGPHG